MEWNASTGQPRVAALRFDAGDQTTSTNVVFTADGRYLLTSLDADDAVLIDAATLRIVRRFGADPQGVSYVAASPTSNLVATAANSGVLRLWNPLTGKQVGPSVRANAGALDTVAFDPTGQMVVTTGADGTTRIWSVPDLQQIGTDLPIRQNVNSLFAASAFVGSGWVARVYASGEGNVWPIDLSTWEQHACSIAARNLTHTEWRLYVGSDRPYQKTCPQFPEGGP
jgi:WD40 repeat protein